MIARRVESLQIESDNLCDTGDESAPCCKV